MADAVLSQQVVFGLAALAVVLLTGLFLVVAFVVLCRIVDHYRRADLDAPDTADLVTVDNFDAWVADLADRSPTLAELRDPGLGDEHHGEARDA